MLRNERGYFLDSPELMRKLGFKPGEKLPDEGFGPVVVEDVMFMCEPSAGLYDIHKGKRVRSPRPHRVRYLCKACRSWVPCGRAAQHNKGKEHKLNYEIMVGRP